MMMMNNGKSLLTKLNRMISRCCVKDSSCFAHICGYLVFGIILNAGCAYNTDHSSSKDLSMSDSINIYYENFIDIYVRENKGTTRRDAEEIIHNTFLKNTKPVTEVLKGPVDRIIIEEYVNSIRDQKVAEFDGDSDEAKSILAALYDSSATIGKTPSHYTLIICFSEQSQPIFVYLEGGLFKIKDKGMYWSEKNLENFIATLVGKRAETEE